MSVLTINKSNFTQEVMESKTPIMLDFWASWCGPCQMFAPTVDAVSEENQGKIKVGKVNIDDEPELAVQFNVNVIPTLVFVKDGKVVKTTVGTTEIGEIQETINTKLL